MFENRLEDLFSDDEDNDNSLENQVVDEEFLKQYDNLPFYEHHRIRVDPGQKLMRIDVFLSNTLKHASRSRIKNACLAGFIRINGEKTKVSYKIKPYDEVSVMLPYPPAPDVEPQDIPLDIVYEDDDFLIVNKVAGMVVHPGSGNFDGTLVNGLLFHFKNTIEQYELPKESIRPGLVHRIDKDTTGLLVVSKNELAYSFLAKQFFERTTDRNYFALVWGNVEKDKGSITGNIGRSPHDRKKFMVFEDGTLGKHAVTHYEVIQRYGVATLVKCKLETGRTHQIRVHFKYIGHTLFGDHSYGGQHILRGKPSKSYQKFMNECLEIMPRQALHAKTLGFLHPTTKERVFFNSELPLDFLELLYKFSKFMNVPYIPDIETYALEKDKSLS